MRRPSPAVLRLLVFFGGLILVLVVLIAFRSIFFPLLLGLGIAYILDGPVSALERRGWSRAVAVAVIGLLLVGALVLLVMYLVPQIGAQLAEVRERLPGYIERLRAQLLPWLADLEARFPEQYAELRPQLEDAARNYLPGVLQQMAVWLAGFLGNVVNLLLFLLNLIFVPVFTFYLLVDFPRLKRGLRELIPLPYRELVLSRLGEVDEAVSAFLRGQLTIAVILAAINATGLMVIGVPLGLLLGIVAGLANMIPYMSLVIGLAPAILLCWAEHQSWARVLAVIAVFAGGNLLEGTVLSPRILGKSVNLHPVWILLAIIIGGSWFGIFGMLLAVPVAAAIKVFVRHWLIAYRSSEIYRGEGRALPPSQRPPGDAATPAALPPADPAPPSPS